jgi:hypothetical protein
MNKVSVPQLKTILEEARHSLIIIEHDPLLYEDTGMMELVSQAMRDAVKEAAVLALLTGNRYVPGGSDQKCRPRILL